MENGLKKLQMTLKKKRIHKKEIKDNENIADHIGTETREDY